MLLFGHLGAGDLARHELLNERDTVLCPDDIRELEALIDDYNAAIDPLLSACRDVKTAEMVAMIDAGIVAPWVSPQDLESSIEDRAAALMAERAMSQDDAREEAAKLLYSVDKIPPGNHIRHDGLVFLSSAFPDLPKTAALFDSVKFIAGEHAAVLVAWFVQRGLCTDPATPATILEGIATRRSR